MYEYVHECIFIIHMSYIILFNDLLQNYDPIWTFKFQNIFAKRLLKVELINLRSNYSSKFSTENAVFQILSIFRKFKFGIAGDKNFFGEIRSKMPTIVNTAPNDRSLRLKIVHFYIT